jgi:hypothetical protein
MVLFMSLVFTAFFLFEMLSALRIHPFQYALVGAALCLFFLSLLSLSEFIALGLAYLAAAAATTLLIWFYCAAVLRAGGARSLCRIADGFTVFSTSPCNYRITRCWGSTGLFIAWPGVPEHKKNQLVCPRPG